MGETGQGQATHGVLCIPSPAGPSSSPQLGDENPDLTSTMMDDPTPGVLVLKLEGKARHSGFQLGCPGQPLGAEVTVERA